MRNFIICTHPQISLGKSSQVKANEVGRACGTCGREKKTVQVVVGNTKEIAQSEDGGVFGSLGLELILGRLAESAQSGFRLLRTGISGCFL
jgi:hypothetical protein